MNADETTDIQPTPENPGESGASPPTPPGQPPAPPGGPSGFKPKRSTGKTAAAIVIGAIGLIIAAAGTVAIVAHAFLRDDDGYYTASTQLETPSYALTTDDIDLNQVGADVPNALVGKIRLQASSDDGKPLFLGIAPTADVNRYLSGVGHRQVSEISTNHDPRYETFPGHAPRSLPGRQNFWAARSQGPGEQTILWDLEPGNWTIVAMNANGSRGVSIDSGIGAKVPWVIWVGVGLLGLGLVSMGGAAALAYSGRSRTT